MNDWVQAGRYVAGLDAWQWQDGPTGPVKAVKAFFGPKIAYSAFTVFSLEAVMDPISGELIVSALVEAQGGESAVGFSLDFAPELLGFISAALGADAPPNTILMMNAAGAAEGRLGVLIGMDLFADPPIMLGPGVYELLQVRFDCPDGDCDEASISFGHVPVAMAVSDVYANEMPFSVTSTAPRLIADLTEQDTDTPAAEEEQMLVSGEPDEEAAEALAQGGCFGCRTGIQLRQGIRRLLGDYLLLGLSLALVAGFSAGMKHSR